MKQDLLLPPLRDLFVAAREEDQRHTGSLIGLRTYVLRVFEETAPKGLNLVTPLA